MAKDPYLERIENKAKKMELLLRFMPYPSFKVRLLRYYTRLYKFGKVVEILEKIPINFPYTYQDRFQLAFTCYKLNQFQKAKQLLEPYFPDKINPQKLVSPYAKGLSLTYKERLILFAARLYIQEIFKKEGIEVTSDIFNHVQLLLDNVILKRIKNKKQSDNSPKTQYVLNALNHFTNYIKDASSVAIVGNGPNLLGKELGKQIDSHDIIVRMNFFHTKGYEQDTGTETDIWVTGANEAYVDKKLDQTPKNILSILKSSSLQNKITFLPTIEKIEERLNKDYKEFIAIPAEQQTLAEVKCLTETPSTGMRSISFIVNICEKNVDLYGFDFFRTTAHHYYDVNCPLGETFKERKMWYVLHDFAWEALYTQILAYKNKVKIL